MAGICEDEEGTGGEVDGGGGGLFGTEFSFSLSLSLSFPLPVNLANKLDIGQEG